MKIPSAPSFITKELLSLGLSRGNYWFNDQNKFQQSLFNSICLNAEVIS